MRDLMFFFGFLALIPIALSNAFVGYLIWGWTSIVAIDNYLYGFMGDFRLNLIFALVALVGIFLKWDKVRGDALSKSPIFVFMGLFLLQITISVIFAYDGNSKNLDLYDKILKSFLYAFLMPLVVVGRYRIHALILMLCLGLGFHGLIDGLKFVSSGGSHNVQGFIKFGDNNHFAVALVMVIPLFVYLTRYSNNTYVRFACAAGAVLNISAVVGTHSRGGLIALLAMAGWLVATSRQKVSGLIMFGIGMAIAISLAPVEWRQRMETIGSADQDSSFMTRVEAWQVSSAIALKHPLTGGGLHAVQVQSVWNQFKGSKGILPFVNTGFVSDVFRAAHSIYFEILGDTGFVGLFLFLAILFQGMYNARRLKLLTKGRESEFGWALDLSKTLSAIIFSFLIGGASVSLAYSEVIYMVVMLTEVLKREVFLQIQAAKKIGDLSASAALASMR